MVGVALSDEAKATKVDAEDGRPRGRTQVGGSDEGAVAAKSNHEFGEGKTRVGKWSFSEGSCRFGLKTYFVTVVQRPLGQVPRGILRVLTMHIGNEMNTHRMAILADPG